MFVFDDECAIIGSANANNRGYFLDSEAAVVVAERSCDKAGGLRRGAWYVTEANFARRLRMELWHHHLGLEQEELFDGIAARTHWENLTESANVELYESVNLARYIPARDAYLAKLSSWKTSKQRAEAAGTSFQEDPPLWDDPTKEQSNHKPWWVPPDDEWDPGWSAEDLLVDPRW